MNIDKMTRKKLYKETYDRSIRFYQGCEGILLVFIVMCYVVKRFAIFPLMNRIWAMALSTLPNQFITDRNAFVLLKYPYVPLIGLLLILVFCYLIAWEISGIMLCLEYSKQEKSFSLWKVLILAAKRTVYLAKPKNWGMFFFLAVILPLTDIYSAAGMLSTFSVPEYIADFIYAYSFTTVLFVLVQIILLVLAVRWFYVLPGSLIYGKDFSVAAKDSARLMKKRSIEQLFWAAVYTVKRSIRLCIVPAVVSSGALLISVLVMKLVGCSNPPAFGLTLKIFGPAFILLYSTFIRIAASCYFVASYEVFAESYGMELNANLPESILEKNQEDRNPEAKKSCDAKNTEVETERGAKNFINRKKSWFFDKIRSIIVGLLTVALAGFFIVISIIFTNNPGSVLDTMSDTIIVAHKGYSSRAPENTMEAFELACKSPAQMIELDIRESKDGIPIVIHNANLYTATGEEGEVYDYTFEELQKFSIRYAFTEEEYPDCKLPSLEQVLERFGGEIPLLIEIKMDDRTPELPKKILDLINKYDCKDTCLIHSGSYEAIEAVKKLDETMPCGYIIAMGTGSYESLPCADFFSVEHTFVTQFMLDKIHSIGKKVFAWTVNEDSAISAMSVLDVDGIITDYPDTVYEQAFSYEDAAWQYLRKLRVPLNDTNDVSKDYVEQNY